MTDLTDHAVLVTGSTKGIGKEIARQFILAGARVIVHGRSPSDTAEVQEEIGAHGHVVGGLGSAEETHQVLDQLYDHGPIDVLVNNAGIFSVEDFFALPDDEWLRYLQINVMSAVRLCRALMPGMLARDRGRIICVASEAGIKPLPQMIHYSVTKTALISLARGLAELTKGTAVTVNSLLPGPTWTAGVEGYFEGLARQEDRPLKEVLDGYFEEHEPTSLIQRFIHVEEVGRAAVFLASNAAVNGSALRVEGGIIRSI